MRVGITGHRGLSSAVEARVRELLDAQLGQYPTDELLVVSCLADGPDTWAAQAVLDRGGQLEAVIPAKTYRESLPDWHHPAYDALLQRASDVHNTGLTESDSHAHMAGSEILVGLCDELLAVWDGRAARGYGGTADVVAYAQRVGVPVRILWPEGAERD